MVGFSIKKALVKNFLKFSEFFGTHTKHAAVFLHNGVGSLGALAFNRTVLVDWKSSACAR